MKYVYIIHKFFGQTIVKQFEFRNAESREAMTDLIHALVANDVPFNVEYSGAIDDNTGLALP
jgi:hypothetical protein